MSLLLGMESEEAEMLYPNTAGCHGFQLIHQLLVPGLQWGGRNPLDLPSFISSFFTAFLKAHLMRLYSFFCQDLDPNSTKT